MGGLYRGTSLLSLMIPVILNPASLLDYQELTYHSGSRNTQLFIAKKA